MAESEQEPPRIKIYWAILLASAGATILFFTIVSFQGFPRGREWWINLWPIISTGGLLISARLLYGYYRNSQAARRGLRLGVGDLILSFMIFGTVPALYQLDENLPPGIGLMIGLIVLVCILVGFMRATKQGFADWPNRHAFALAHALRSVGIIGIGGIGAVMVMATIAGENPVRILRELFGFSNNKWSIALTSYAIIIAFVVGVAMCRSMNRRMLSSQPNP
jgi:hypothetical protein